MLKSDYDFATATEETREAMADRCYAEGHQWENCCSVIFRVYQQCKWCGAEK